MIETCQTNPNCEIKPSNCKYAVRCTTCEDLANNKEVYVCELNDCKEIMGDKEMEKSKIVGTIDYDKEVDTLLKMGGQKALENQYKNISRRLDVISDENKRLRDKNELLENAYKKSQGAFYQSECKANILEKRLMEKDGADCGLNFDSPLDFAKSLIEHRTHIEERAIENAKGAVLVLVPEHDRVTFDFDELEEIADYLLTYCKHNKEDL